MEFSLKRIGLIVLSAIFGAILCGFGFSLCRYFTEYIYYTPDSGHIINFSRESAAFYEAILGIMQGLIAGTIIGGIIGTGQVNKYLVFFIGAGISLAVPIIWTMNYMENFALIVLRREGLSLLGQFFIGGLVSLILFWLLNLFEKKAI